MDSLSSDRLHATTVAIDGVAVMIEGASGSGKSDLALRLIDRGAVLVSDDQTLVVRSGSTLNARAPTTIAGRIEVRGIGILAMPHVADVPVGLLVRIDAAIARMPEPGVRRIAGIDVREFAVDAFHASAPIKVELALRNPEPLE
ncbi:aldolase [Sphingomonas sp. PB2P12]|uniref:HPr kinase/phosphorylase n=1 Tax=Sphingomonas sandaracina TaxID=3096157 RepID=UPI002FC8BA09